MVNSSSISITPATHADRHVVGGADPLQNPLLLHASRHAYGGDDVLGDESYELSNDVLVSNDIQKNTTNLAYTKIKETAIVFAATARSVRVTMEVYGRTAANMWFRLYVNGVAAGTEHYYAASSDTWYVHTEDISVKNGDLIQVYSKTSNGGTGAAVKNFRILGKNTYLTLTGTAQDP